MPVLLEHPHAMYLHSTGTVSLFLDTSPNHSHGSSMEEELPSALKPRGPSWGERAHRQAVNNRCTARWDLSLQMEPLDMASGSWKWARNPSTEVVNPGKSVRRWRSSIPWEGRILVREAQQRHWLGPKIPPKNKKPLISRRLAGKIQQEPRVCKWFQRSE